MKLRLIVALAACAAATALANSPGKPAPDFALVDADAKTVKLSDYKGKYVVLEWTNPDCPFVRNHYRTQNMQRLQREWGAADVVWVTINSTSQSHPEFRPPRSMVDWMTEQRGAARTVLVDPTSGVARTYAVKTTPQMVVINPKGTVIYAGAIDDRPSTRAEDPRAALNYVQAALTEATAGRAVATASTTPYGCSLKY